MFGKTKSLFLIVASMLCGFVQPWNVQPPLPDTLLGLVLFSGTVIIPLMVV